MNRVTSRSRSPEDAAASWVARQDAGLSPAETAELAAWLEASPAHRLAFERYRKVLAAVGRPQRTGAGRELEDRLADLARNRRRRRSAWRAGAALTLVVIATFWAWPRVAPDTDRPAPTTATLLLPRQQLLPDGTRVEFPEGAVFTVDFTGRTRRVLLARGEAIFFVAKHPEWPFVVEAGGVEFRAVGTAFAVHLRSLSAELVVTEGQVAVERAGTPVLFLLAGPSESAPHVIGAGHRVSVALSPSAAAPSAVNPVSAGDLAERLAWRHPRAEFSGTPLREIVDLLNRQNATKLVLEDASLAEVELSGVFRTDDLDSLVRALELGFAVRTERREDAIHLHRRQP